MALSLEEIRVKMGLDYSKVTAGMTDLKAKVGKFAADIKTQFVGMFAAGAVVGQLKNTIDFVEQLAQRADALGVPKSFLQDLQNIGAAAGKSSEQMQQLLTKFALKVQPGQNIQEEFMKFLDLLKNTKDPAERAALAFDRLGKSGIILLDVAKDGSKAFEELGKQFDKLSDKEIDAVLKADAVLDKMVNKLKIYTAKVISFFADLKFSNFTEGERRVAEMEGTLRKQQLHRQTQIAAARELAAASAGKELDAQAKITELVAKQVALQNSAKPAQSGAYNPGFLHGRAARKVVLGPDGLMVKDGIEYLPGGQGPTGTPPAKQSYADMVKARNLQWQQHVAGLNSWNKPPTSEPATRPEDIVQKVRIVEIDE